MTEKEQAIAEKEAIKKLRDEEYKRFLENESEFVDALNALLVEADEVLGGDNDA